MAQKVEVGDVFLIPIDGDRYGLGQIAGEWKGELYLVVYDRTVGIDAAPNHIDGADLQIATLSLDGRLYNKIWPIIGNRKDNLAAIPQPWFKVGHGGQIYVESRDRSIFRPAREKEAGELQLRTVSSPMLVEKALKARHGIGDWRPEYDDFVATYAIRCKKLFSGG